MLQRQWFREHWNGGKGELKGYLMWGKQVDYVLCSYAVPNPKTGKLEHRDSILLASGFWGVARHAQYFFELCAAYSWGLLAGMHSSLPLSYPIFLTVLLVHRAIRDQEKCVAKYGKGYEEYMQKVPYKIIPGIF